MNSALSSPITPWWRRPIVLSTLAVLLIVAGTIGWSMYAGLRDEASQARANGLPWQVQVRPEGRSEVFGLTLGQATLGDLQARFGDELHVGLIVPNGGEPALEAFVESLRAGFVTGRLVAAFEADPAWLARARQRSPRNDVGEGGRSRRYHLAADDLAQVRSARLTALAYLPAVKLDAEMVQQRFGHATERVSGPGGEAQWLYPALGVAVALPPAEGENAKARAVIQYVAPKDFDARLRAPLRAAPAAPAASSSGG